MIAAQPQKPSPALQVIREVVRLRRMEWSARIEEARGSGIITDAGPS